MGDLEKECIKRILDIRKKFLIFIWNCMNKDDILYLIECNLDIIYISVLILDIQIYLNFKKDKNWIEKNLKESVFFVKNKGYEVIIGFEDVLRVDINYFIELCKIVKEMDVRRIRYVDIVGILILFVVKKVIEIIISVIGIEIEMYVYNDFGMVILLFFEVVKSGVKYVDCILDGIGERVGNCNL